MKSMLEGLEKTLPPISSTKTLGDPIVYAKLYIPGSNRAWYILQGERQDDEFVFFGYERRNHYSDPHSVKGERFTYSFLQKAGTIVRSSIEIDLSFRPQPLSFIEREEA